MIGLSLEIEKRGTTMGIYICLEIAPKRIEPENWRKAYHESLRLVENYPFLDICFKEYYGKKYEFACRTAHKKKNEQDDFGYWETCGNMLHGQNTEWFGVYEDLNQYRSIFPSQKDTIEEPDILLAQYGIPYTKRVFENKTQGEDSHIYLLAIACLICHRFSYAATVYGDISAGQCRKAVRWANQFLEEPIEVPVNAQASCLLSRIEKMGYSELETMKWFYQLTLEEKNWEMGELIRQHLSEESIHRYYKERLLKYYEPGQPFRVETAVMKEYLRMGFSFQGLCEILAVDSEGPELDERELLKIFLKMKLHVKEKNTRDFSIPFCQQGDHEEVGNVKYQIVQVMSRMMGAGNWNVDAYIPLEEIYAQCQKILHIPLDRLTVIGDEILVQMEESEKESAQKLFYDDHDSKFAKIVNKYSELDEQYDICEPEQLIDFKKGARVEPRIQEGMKRIFKKLHTFAREEAEVFFSLSQDERKHGFLKNLHFLISEEIRERIFRNIMDDKFILRYVALSIVDVRMEKIAQVVQYCYWNPELLDYYWELTETQED